MLVTRREIIVADQNPNSTFLGVPQWLWLAVIMAVSGVANTAMQQRNHARLELNAKQAAEEHAEVTKKLTSIREETAKSVVAVEQNVKATQAIPVAAAEAAHVVVEEKMKAARGDDDAR
jgi:hypothetical protein